MDNTGERHITSVKSYDEASFYGHLMHLFSYKQAENYTTNKKVLDYGCGSGYGTEILSRNAKSVLGVDISSDAISYAKSNFKNNKTSFISIKKLFQNPNFKEFDIITSFQVIEHVNDESLYLSNIHNLLKKGGKVIFTTPNKKFRLFPIIQKPWNQFHIKEYDMDQLFNILINKFEKVEPYFITATEDFVKHEIKRVNFEKKINLPATLIIFPKFFRIFLQKLLKLSFKTLSKLKSNKFEENKKDISFKSNYSIDDLRITRESKLGTDLFFICTK